MNVTIMKKSNIGGPQIKRIRHTTILLTICPFLYCEYSTNIWKEFLDSLYWPQTVVDHRYLSPYLLHCHLSLLFQICLLLIGSLINYLLLIGPMLLFSLSLIGCFLLSSFPIGSIGRIRGASCPDQQTAVLCAGLKNKKIIYILIYITIFCVRRKSTKELSNLKPYPLFNLAELIKRIRTKQNID